MIEFDPDGAKAYAQKQVDKGCNVILPPPPFNCRVGRQEQYTATKEGVTVTSVHRDPLGNQYTTDRYTWKQISKMGQNEYNGNFKMLASRLRHIGLAYGKIAA